MIIKFGMLTDPIKAVPEEIIRIKRLGFDYVEIGIEEPLATPRILTRQRKRIMRLLSDNEMGAIGHSAYWVQFGSAHEKARRGWIEEAKDMIRVASQLELDLLNFHFYGKLGRVGHTQESVNIFLENFSNAMRELCQFSKRKRVELMLENVPVADGGTGGIRNFSKVMESVPELNCHLDIAHAFIEGGMERIKSYLTRFNERLVHIHIHDNHGKLDEHLPLGAGSINFKSVIKWLRQIEYSRTITFEVFSAYQDCVRSREYFKKLWEQNK
ncbi:MAG TPA: sugar phosphate isomerase/epimerase [Candidatus Bathyarchaeia archaeon]|nr:sugar phosphate isomerase/epimerase [Candidatus Bathyarchaeia archaeon]